MRWKISTARFVETLEVTGNNAKAEICAGEENGRLAGRPNRFNGIWTSWHFFRSIIWLTEKLDARILAVEMQLNEMERDVGCN